jgi:hypothetical protein
LGASDESFTERRKQTTDLARFGFDHSRILLRGAAGVVIFQHSGLRSTLLSLNTRDQYRHASVICSCWEIAGEAEKGMIVKTIFIGMAVAFAFVTGMALSTIIAQIAS